MLFYLFPLEIDALDDELEDDPLLTLDDGLELVLDLEIEEDPVNLKKVENISAFDQLMANIHECETEMHSDSAFYQLLQRGDVDAAVLSFYNLDDEIRQAVLQ